MSLAAVKSKILVHDLKPVLMVIWLKVYHIKCTDHIVSQVKSEPKEWELTVFNFNEIDRPLVMSQIS